MRRIGLFALVATVITACGTDAAPIASAPTTPPPSTSADERVTPTAPVAVIPSAEPTGCGWGPASPTPGPDIVVVFFSCSGAFDPAQPAGAFAGRRVDPDAILTKRIETAIDGLLAGPTDEERDAGLTSWFSRDTAGMLRAVTVENGLATIDFADFSRIIPNASTSAGSQMLLSELNTTMFQFEEIGGIRYQFDGRCDAFWEWLQTGCTTVTRG